MNYSFRLIRTFLVLGILLVGACASHPIAGLVSDASAPNSPTPFQPEIGSIDSPFAAPLPATAMPTITPYPTLRIPSISLPTNVPLPGASSGENRPAIISLNNPLTGLPVADPGLLDRRPIAIKIANSPDYIRPQSGLTLADVVFEYYIEWGDTRFIAVFYGNEARRAGPVRSGRYFDEHVARMYHAYYVFKGADEREFNYFKETDLQNFLVDLRWLEFPCSPYEIGDRKVEEYNNIFFNTLRFTDCLKRKNLDNNQQVLRSSFFNNQPLPDMQAASRIYTAYSAYSYNYWEYDAKAGKYFRYQEATDLIKKRTAAYTPLTDYLTGLTVSADNVVVIFVRHTFANSFDQEDEVYHIDLIDSGEAFVFRDGGIIPAQWYRTDIDQPLLLVSALGTPIYLKPGVTFYQVIGETSTMTQSDDAWHFGFLTP